MFDRLRTLCKDAVADGVVPGLAVAVGRAGRTLFQESHGWRQTTPKHLPATDETIYDLASLTKALCTSLMAMDLVQTGAIDLSDRISLAAPHGPRPQNTTEGATPYTVRDLLAHAAGLPAHEKIYLDVRPNPNAPALGERVAHDAIITRAITTPAQGPVGTHSLYSDLGFIVLGAALEQAAGTTLSAWFEKRIARPLHRPTLGFRPLPPPQGSATADTGATTALPIAATEDCAWRGRVLVGEVHDQNAWAMGGVAGHAGLFGTLADVTTLAHALCAAFSAAAYTPLPRPLLDQTVLQEFWRPVGVPGSTWRLGWDGPAAGASLAGDVITRTAVGHLGFTGCSLWVDPDQATFVVMLSNRIHPQVTDNPAFRRLRPAINDAALMGCQYHATP